MHALDDGIRRHHDVLPSRFKHSSIVVEPKRAGIACQRLEIARDKRVLT
jgi:tRNA A58 N-methylase Trm61